MAKININLGTPPSGTDGDPVRTAFEKTNSMFSELYLGLGTSAAPLPVVRGGTGANNAAGARANLELGNAAVMNVGSLPGQLMAVTSFGLGVTYSGGLSLVSSVSGSLVDRVGWYRYSADTVGRPNFGSGYGTILSMPSVSDSAGNYGTQLVIDYAATEMGFRRLTASTGWSQWAKCYTTANTTLGSGGAIIAASPIVRLANTSESERPDLVSSDFKTANKWGAVNFEARGCKVYRVSVGKYKITGALGLASEGWRVQDPKSPDGGKDLGITETEVLEDGTVFVYLHKQKWTMSDDGEITLGKGDLIDVPLNSWIDVRLDMPKVENNEPLS